MASLDAEGINDLVPEFPEPEVSEFPEPATFYPEDYRALRTKATRVRSDLRNVDLALATYRGLPNCQECRLFNDELLKDVNAIWTLLSEPLARAASSRGFVPVVHAQSAVTAPAWAGQPPPRDDRSLYGLAEGKGSSLAAAKADSQRAALDSLASELGAVPGLKDLGGLRGFAEKYATPAQSSFSYDVRNKEYVHWTLLRLDRAMADPALIAPFAGGRRATVFVGQRPTGRPIANLTPADFVIDEAGAKAEVLSAQQVTESPIVGLVLDGSEPLRGSFWQRILSAVTRFLRALPAGSRYAVWTTGTPPHKRIDFSDSGEAPSVLGTIIPSGTNNLFDVIQDACTDLERYEGRRRVLVIVTSAGADRGGHTARSLAQRARRCDGLVMAVELTSVEWANRPDLEQLLSGLTEKSGGFTETSLSDLGISRALEKIGAAIQSEYRVEYRVAAPRRGQVDIKRIRVAVTGKDAEVRVTKVE